MNQKYYTLSHARNQTLRLRDFTKIERGEASKTIIWVMLNFHEVYRYPSLAQVPFHLIFDFTQ